MWPSAFGYVYFAGIAVQAFMAVYYGQKLRLRPHLPLIVSICYFLGMTVGAKAVFDAQAGVFSDADNGTGPLLRKRNNTD